MSQRTMKQTFLVFVITLGIIPSVFAQALVVEEETPPAEQSSAGYDGGFYIKSPDGNFKFTINGRVQPRFDFSRQAGTTSPQGNTTDSFFVRRGRVAFTAELFKKFETVVFADHNSLSKKPLTPFVWSTFHASPAFNLSMGMVSLPMDRMGENGSGWYQMVEAPLTATQEDGVKDLTISRQSFGLPFDLGLRAEGDIGQFFYAVGFGNGSGAWSGLNPNDAFSYGLRLAYNILNGGAPYKDYVLGGDDKPLLSVGFGTGFEDENATETVQGAALVRSWRWSVSGDVAFRYLGWSLTAEMYHRLENIQGGAALEDVNGDGKLRDIGYYIQAGYFIIPKKFQLVALGSQVFREGPDNNANEFGGGVNWYLYDNKIKLQLDYTNVLDYDDIFGTANNTQNRIRTMLTCQF